MVMMKRSLLFSLSLIFGVFSHAQITLDPLAISEVCPGVSFDVSFQATGAFVAGNNFIVELSDATGSFAAPVMIGSQFGTGSALISCNAPLGTDGTGYLVRVRSTMPVMQSAASATALNFHTPDAGMGTSISICGIVEPVDFETMLGGTPDPGGTWTIVSGSGTWVSPPSGLYTGITYGANAAEYTVTEGGCTASTIVTYNAVLPPNAGTSGTLTVCSNSAPFALYGALGGAPDPGGDWTSPNGALVSGIFDPAVDPSGAYTYTVIGQAPCLASSSTIILFVNQAPDAGVDSNFSFCASLGPQDLFTQLAGTPVAGGTWTYMGAPHSAIYDPATDASGAYVYTVPGNAPCVSAAVTLTVTELNCAIGPPLYNYDTE